MTYEQDKAEFPLYSEALFFAFFSIYAYAITFFYEAGFLRYFSIPPLSSERVYQ